MELIDISLTENAEQKAFMRSESKSKDNKIPMPPQIFNDDTYCGVCTLKSTLFL